MERQVHGFVFEDYIVNKFNIVKTSNYTNKWDSYLNNIPVSIKFEQYGTDIEMADYFRNAINEDDFYLIVGFWEGSKDNIVEEHCLFINGKEWHSLFPTHFTDDFQELLANITNDRADDQKWKKQITYYKKAWKEETSNLVRPRFKRDHKKQKRMQCAINNKDFYSYFLKKYEVVM